MDFELNNKQRDIKKAARDFALGEFTAVARDYDLHEIFPRDVVNKARKLGFMGLFIPERYGGRNVNEEKISNNAYRWYSNSNIFQSVELFLPEKICSFFHEFILWYSNCSYYTFICHKVY